MRGRDLFVRELFIASTRGWADSLCQYARMQNAYMDGEYSTRRIVPRAR